MNVFVGQFVYNKNRKAYIVFQMHSFKFIFYLDVQLQQDVSSNGLRYYISYIIKLSLETDSDNQDKFIIFSGNLMNPQKKDEK
jgi:hypothetical protein